MTVTVHRLEGCDVLGDCLKIRIQLLNFIKCYTLNVVLFHPTSSYQFLLPNETINILADGMTCSIEFAYLQAYAANDMGTALVWAITQRVMVIQYGRFGTGILFRNFGTELPLLTALIAQKSAILSKELVLPHSRLKISSIWPSTSNLHSELLHSSILAFTCLQNMSTL